jgi:hypothetical protein
MLTRVDEIKALFMELQPEIDTEVNIYVLGGGVLLARGMKAMTKDIDIVVDKKPEF